jgi:hypothetical protein
MEFSWWRREPIVGKYRVRADYHGGQIGWQRQNARGMSWEAHAPTPEDWARLMEEAERRVPRRLLSPRQFEEIKQRREQASL